MERHLGDGRVRTLNLLEAHYIDATGALMLARLLDRHPRLQVWVAQQSTSDRLTHAGVPADRIALLGMGSSTCRKCSAGCPCPPFPIGCRRTAWPSRDGPNWKSRGRQNANAGRGPACGEIQAKLFCGALILRVPGSTKTEIELKLPCRSGISFVSFANSPGRALDVSNGRAK
jgi:hypothetical protein